MDFMVTGTIRSSHGLDGFVKVESASGEVDHFAGLSTVYLRERGSTENLGRPYEIEAAEGSSALLLLKFRGIDTAEQAKRLAGAQILVPRDMACPLDEGEYYVSDLCQCVLVYDGMTMGKIIDVVEGGAGDLLEVALTDGEHRLVPLRKEFIGKIDIQAGTVELMHRWILE